MKMKKESTLKKNTLLYLNSDLVKKAKEHNINISNIAEQAIQSELRTYETDFNPEKYLEDQLFKWNGWFFPFKIQAIELENFGKFKKTKIEFDKGINFIVGDNATGKTTIVMAITEIMNNVSTKNKDKTINKESKNAKVKLFFPKNINFIEVEFNRDKNKYQCIILDDAFSRLDLKHALDFFNYLKKLNCQLILTGTEFPDVKDKVNLIILK